MLIGFCLFPNILQLSFSQHTFILNDYLKNSTIKQLKKELDIQKTVINAITTGTTNMFATIGAGIGGALKGMPSYTETSIVLANMQGTETLFSKIF